MAKKLSKKKISVVSWNISNPVESDKIIHEISADEILKVNADVNIIREEFGTSEEFMVNLVSGTYMRYSTKKHFDLKKGFLSIMIKNSVRSKFQRTSTEWNIEENQPTFLNVTLGSDKGTDLHIIGVRFSDELEERNEELRIFTEYLKNLKGEIVLSGNFVDFEFEKIDYKRVDGNDDFIKFSNIRNLNSQGDFLSVMIDRNIFRKCIAMVDIYCVDNLFPLFLMLPLKLERKELYIIDVRFSKISKKRTEEIEVFTEYLKLLDGEIILSGNFEDSDFEGINFTRSKI